MTLGNGLSDRGPAGQTFEDELDDVRLVLDAVASRRAAFFGCHIGGRLALLFAATYPERTRAVVTFAAHPATLPADDYPWGSTPEQREWLLAAIKHGPPDPAGLLPRVAPRESADPSFRHWWQMFYRSATTAPEAYDMVVSLSPVDIRRLLGSIRVPTLLLHRTGDQWVDVRASRYMAERLPDARLEELPGDDLGGIAVHIAARVLAQAGRARSGARARSRTWSPGPALRSPTMAAIASRAFPTSGSCSRWSWRRVRRPPSREGATG